MDSRKPDLSLIDGVIWRSILRFFFPIAIGMIFQQLYNTVDAVIVGKYVGTDALAAVGGSAAVIMSLFIGIFSGLSSGASVVISHCFGMGDDDSLSRGIHTAIALCLFIGTLFTIIGLLVTEPFLRLLNTPEDVMDFSVTYLRICFLGSIPVMLFNMGSSIMRAMGDSRRPLYYLIFCCLMNIALDLVFVVIFCMDVDGVAIATILAQLMSSALVLIRLGREADAYRLRLRSIRFDRPILKRMLAICLPSGIENSMYSVSNIILQTAINGLGTNVMAAWSITGKVDGIYWALVMSFGAAMMTFVGQNHGAGKRERIKKGVKTCLFMSIAMTVVVSALILLLGQYCYGIFTDDPIVVEYCVTIMGYFVPFYFIWTFIEILSNSLRGTGDALIPMIISVGGICGMRILWVLTVVPAWGTLFSICFCYPVTWLITAVAFIAYYLYRQRRQANPVT